MQLDNRQSDTAISCCMVIIAPWRNQQRLVEATVLYASAVIEGVSVPKFGH
jgi:hypothetical protein